MALARVTRSGGRPRVGLCEFRAWEGDDNRVRTLARLAADYDLKHARVTTLLDEADYKLLLTEAPDVKPDELKAAIRWRVKDLIDFHINDATLDVFELPTVERHDGARAMYAVVARNEAIRRRVEQISQTGANLQVIDIPELAQRNLAATLAEDAGGVAVLSLSPSGGLITVTKQGLLYLSRGLDIGMQALQGTDRFTALDQMVLEVQRSLDYFESHFRQSPINHLFVFSDEPVSEVAAHLKTNLNLNVEILDLARVLEWEKSVPEPVRARCAYAIGAALRQEAKAL